ncbi:hypothetical protein ABK040_011328 [Willaertia magna]
MISQSTLISPPPFKKKKFPAIVNSNESPVLTLEKSMFLKLKQFELFNVLSFLTDCTTSFIDVLCLKKNIFNELFNENTLQKNVNQFIERKEVNFISILLTIHFNYKLNLFVNIEIFNNLSRTIQCYNQSINNENIFTVLHNYLNNNLYNNIFTKNVNFYCNDGKEHFSNDTMIYREDDDDFLQFDNKYYLQKISEDNYKRMCHSSLQNENYLLFSNLKNTLNRLRNCFDFLTCHIQSLQSYFYKRKQWSTWLNELSNRYKDNDEKLQNIQHELKTKIFDKVNFVKVKKSDIFDFHICITKYKIGENLEFKYSAAGSEGNPFVWSTLCKVYHDNEIFTLIESDTSKIKINLQHFNKIKTILQIDNFVSNELLVEAILISCPQWNILKFIKEDFDIKIIDFSHNDITATNYFSDNDEEEEENNVNNDDEDSGMEENKRIEKDIGTFVMVENQKNKNKFTITDLPVELLNYICNYLFYLKDGLSFGLVSKDIYNSIYYNNNLFNANKIIKDNLIPLIMTTIYSDFNQQKLAVNKECDKEVEKRNNFYFDLTFSGYSEDFKNYNNYYFKLFTTNLERIEHFIGYIDSLQRFIYVKQFEFDNFLNGINDKYISQQLNDKIFKKLIYQSSQINALDDQWQYKALFHIDNCIYFEQVVRVVNYNYSTIFWNIKINNNNDTFEYIDIYKLKDHLLEKIDEKQLRKYLDLEDEKVTIDLIFKCLKCCSPFKFEFIEYSEEHNLF